jgi:hypothetical protein
MGKHRENKHLQEGHSSLIPCPPSNHLWTTKAADMAQNLNMEPQRNSAVYYDTSAVQTSYSFISLLSYVINIFRWSWKPAAGFCEVLSVHI